MGASGSGKTTFIRLINRLSELDSGIILLNGNDIKSHVPVELSTVEGGSGLGVKNFHLDFSYQYCHIFINQVLEKNKHKR